jgi:glycosyltransferase involved in cell wall biosynthesis
MAAGLPLVLFWDEGYAAWLDRDVVAACDTLDAIGPTVVALAKDAPRRKLLSERARDWTVSRWSWSATVRAYEAIYDTLRKGVRHAA